MKYYLEEKQAVLSELKSSENGLSSQEAAKRLARDGANKLEESKKESLFVRFLKQMADPMILVLHRNIDQLGSFLQIA